MDGKKASRIKYDLAGLDFSDHSNYPVLMNESIDTILCMCEVFKNISRRFYGRSRNH